MARQRLTQQAAVLPCELTPEARAAADHYVDALRSAAPAIGDHGLSEADFWATGLFATAIEKLRGAHAATMDQKRGFVRLILDYLKSREEIAGWISAGGKDRHDYEVQMPDGRIVAIEAKGCLDGNNTNIFKRPPNADEFLIWSLCQNPGADPRHNAWSGIHTRLGAQIIAEQTPVDGLIIWDMICATKARACPKTASNPGRLTQVEGKLVPPPCIYLFPRTIPDPRNNPNPPCWKLEDLRFLSLIHRVFLGADDEVTQVRLFADIDPKTASTRRTTTLVRASAQITASRPTIIKRTK